MEARGLTMRPWRDRPGRPLSLNGLRWVLANKFYMGVVEHNGVEHQGHHEPLVDSQTFEKVQAIITARGAEGTREIRHHHYLKGALVCGRRLSVQVTRKPNRTGKLTVTEFAYFYCLGQKDRRNRTGCREAYIGIDALERQVEALYERIQLRPDMAERLHHWLEAELITREDSNAAERDFQASRLAKVEAQRRKLLDAYYAGAIDVTTLRDEQARLRAEGSDVEERLRSVDATLAQWQEVFDIALRFAATCATACRMASDPARKLYNRAVFDRLLVVDGRISEPVYAEPFGLVLGINGFEHGSLERETRLELATPTLAR